MDDLGQLLDRPSGGVIFTTLQKFAPEPGATEYPTLTDRRNVVVIADEAHRSQYGFRARMDRSSGELSYGFAKYLRDGLPNASFIGFSGTPIEALKKLINGEVRAQSQRNVTQTKAFTERLEAAIARYHANALTTAQVLEELIALARAIRVARSRGEETGLSDDEIAFYDALADNESARTAMGEPALRVIAHELVASVRGNISVDWTRREPARARMRVLVKRILRKYGYPPDLQDAAVQNVLQQAEALSAAWAM